MSKFALVISLFISATMVTSQGLDLNNILVEKGGLSQKITVNIQIPHHPRINTTSGLLIGTTLKQAHAFYSVPYAEEPIRFMPPVPVSYRGQLNVSSPDYVMCTQAEFYQKYKFAKFQDDCLVLNIHVPSSVNLNQVQSFELLPVMVYIHGGSFYIGAGTEPDVDGQFLSNSTNSVVVTINYRLDVLGFFAYEEGNVKYEGNQGLKDQQVALKWVQDNILRFGGDKNQVTIFGNSAGAQSVMLHLLSDVSDALFNRAILQSASVFITYPTVEETKPVIQALTEVLNCSSSIIDCLTNSTSMDIVNALPMVEKKMRSVSLSDAGEPYRPIIDGVEFSDQPLHLFRDGKWQKHKEVIIGTNTMEAANVIISLGNITLEETTFKTASISSLGPYFGSLSADKYLKYANTSDLDYDYNELLGLMVTDFLFTCPNRALARYMVDTSTTPSEPKIYLYEFAHNPGNGAQCVSITSPSSKCAYPYHAAEVTFVFNSGSILGYTNTENDLKVVNQMSSFWGTFAHSGSPSADQNIWPSYNKQAQGNIEAWTNVVIKAPTSSLKTGYRQSQCDFWDSVLYAINKTDVATSTQAAANAVNVTTPAINETDDVTSALTTISWVPATTADTNGTNDVTSALTTTSGTCSTTFFSDVNLVLAMMVFMTGYILM